MPFAAITRAPAAAVRFGPISAIVPLRMRKSPSVRPTAVTISPLRMISSAGSCALASATSANSTARKIDSPRPLGPRVILVGSGEQCFRDGEAERFGGFEVEHRHILGRHLHREVGGLLSLKDTIDVAGGTPVLVDRIRPVGDQAAAGNEKAERIDCGQAVP